MHREMKHGAMGPEVKDTASPHAGTWPPIGVEALQDRSRVDVAYSAHQAAYEKCKALEVSVRSAFEQLCAAEARLKDEFGVTTSVELGFPLSYALAEWRVKHLPPGA